MLQWVEICIGRPAPVRFFSVKKDLTRRHEGTKGPASMGPRPGGRGGRSHTGEAWRDPPASLREALLAGLHGQQVPRHECAKGCEIGSPRSTKRLLFQSARRVFARRDLRLSVNAPASLKFQSARRTRARRDRRRLGPKGWPMVFQSACRALTQHDKRPRPLRPLRTCFNPRAGLSPSTTRKRWSRRRSLRCFNPRAGLSPSTTS
jgi:hypothetical protein